ncbi:MAG: OmpA family protein [Bacteroidota bacterium]
MRKLLNSILILGMLSPIFAQQDLKRANTYFERAFYSDAIPLYEQLLPRNKSSKLIKNLADSYYNTYDMKSAARWYTYLVANYGEEVEREYHFRLNQSLKALGDYEQANKVLLDYYTQQGSSAMVEKIKREITYLENISAIGDRFTIENLALNTENSEFGAVKVDSNLIYNASRKRSGLSSRLYRWNNQGYLDIYMHPIDQLGVGDSLSKPLPGSINTKMHEGTFTITADRKVLFYTRNNGKKKADPKKIAHLKIYRAEWIDGEWKNNTELPFNSDTFSNEHPVLNSDGTKLYFASDREGGSGSFDIYYVDILEGGTYGDPINLGENINTDKKEQFPFIDKAGNLYFSSNGHPGYGSLDIFVSKYENGSYQKPDNLGLPVNSGFDDFSLTLNLDGKHGFFSSNRPGGKGSDDIYSLLENKPLIIEDCKQYISGTLVDQVTGLPIPAGQVILMDSNGSILETHTTNQEAKYSFQVKCDQKYRLEGKKDSYEPKSRTIATNTERNTAQDGSLSLLSIAERKKQEAVAQQRKKEAEVQKAKEEAERIKRQEALANAERLKKEKEQQILAEKKRKEKMEKAIQKEKSIVREDERIVIKTENILFDYNLWYLRRESRKRLSELIKILKENPGIVLEIGTHTDIRGNRRYNEDLSQKRANSVREFLIGSNIAKNRIIAKGYGESQPVFYCKTEESCSEEDHELNRRCEFVIVDWK